MPPKRKAPKTKKRKGPAGDASITSAEVLDAIRCPVCREVALPPINQCRNGHVLCKDCLDQLKDRREPCPTCRVPLQHYSVIRCLALEHVASSLSVECPHDGCSAVCKYNEVSDHIRECPFKPFPCPLCHRWEGPLDDMEDHIKRCHDLDVDESGEVAIFSSSDGFEADIQGIYTHGDERFLGVTFNGASITFMHLRDPAEATDDERPWTWTLSLFGPDGIETTHTRRCASIRSTCLDELPINCRVELPDMADFTLVGLDGEALPTACEIDEDDVVAAEEDGEDFFCYQICFSNGDESEDD